MKLHILHNETPPLPANYSSYHRCFGSSPVDLGSCTVLRFSPAAAAGVSITELRRPGLTARRRPPQDARRASGGTAASRFFSFSGLNADARRFDLSGDFVFRRSGDLTLLEALPRSGAGFDRLLLRSFSRDFRSCSCPALSPTAGSALLVSALGGAEAGFAPSGAWILHEQVQNKYTNDKVRNA